MELVVARGDFGENDMRGVPGAEVQAERRAKGGGSGKEEGQQRIEKVTSGAGMQTEAALQFREWKWMHGKFGEDTQLDGA